MPHIISFLLRPKEMVTKLSWALNFLKNFYCVFWGKDDNYKTNNVRKMIEIMEMSCTLNQKDVLTRGHILELREFWLYWFDEHFCGTNFCVLFGVLIDFIIIYQLFPLTLTTLFIQKYYRLTNVGLHSSSCHPFSFFHRPQKNILLLVVFTFECML